MKRRDFVKNTALGTLGITLMPTVGALAAPKVTHLESEDLTLLPAIKDEFPLHFMALGDWGRNGEYDQLEVAKQMGQWGTDHPNSFVISCGDNFYPSGVVSENDPLFHYSFENIYTAHSLQCDWYPVLGNHDYHTNVDAQVMYSKVSRRWNMPGRYYSKLVNLKKDKEIKGREEATKNGKILFIMMDTDPFLHESKKDYVEAEMKWLNDTLKQASADVRWKIVVGHHPMYTVGPRIENYDTMTMRNALSKTFEEHKVDIYLSGHEHSLQHLKTDSYTHQFISGAGSELTKVTEGIAYSKFQASEHGFLYFSMDDNRINVKAINYLGKILYETELKK